MNNGPYNIYIISLLDFNDFCLRQEDVFNNFKDKRKCRCKMKSNP